MTTTTDRKVRIPWRINLWYGSAALLLLAIEIGIAVGIDDRFIRPYFGDYLVVILLYCGVRAFVSFPPVLTAAGVLAFAFLVEGLQYFRLVELLGLGQYRLARIIVGSSFEWLDLLAYTLGIGTVLLLERLAHQLLPPKTS